MTVTCSTSAQRRRAPTLSTTQGSGDADDENGTDMAEWQAHCHCSQLHCHFGGRPMIISVFEQIIKYIEQSPGVWFTRHSELGRWALKADVDEHTYRQLFREVAATPKSMTDGRCPVPAHCRPRRMEGCEVAVRSAHLALDDVTAMPIAPPSMAWRAFAARVVIDTLRDGRPPARLRIRSGCRLQ